MRGIKEICFGFGVLIVTACLCIACITGSAKAETKVVVGLNSDARSLDPVLTADTTTRRVLRHLYDDLFSFDSNMKVVPMLAESFELIDNTTWRIKLKKGIRFHNGELFNAEAAKFTIDYVLNPTNKCETRSYIDRIDRVELIDDFSIKIITKGPFPTLLENLSDVFIAPPKLVKEKGMAYLSEHPVGTGPYKLESWSKDREIQFVTNDQYWKGIPQIDKLVFRIIPEVGPRVSALMVGEVDLIPDIPPHLIKQINDSGIASVKNVPGNRIMYIGLINLHEGPLQDIRVRQALNYGVNVDEIIQTVMEGYATRVPSTLIPINKHFDRSLKPYPYDPEKAKSLLAEAGYKNGLTLTLNACQGRYLKDKEFSLAIAAQLAKIGVNVKVVFHEWGTFLNLMNSYKAKDMFVMGRPDREFDGGMMWMLHKSKNPWVMFSDPEIDKELEKAVLIMNQTERAKAMNRLQEIIQKKAPFIFLWEQHDLYGVSNRLDWKPRADGHFYLFNAKVKN